YTPPPNVHGDGAASFAFQVEDDGGTANGGVDLDPTPNTLTIDVDSATALYFPAIGNGAVGPDLFVLHDQSTPRPPPVRTAPAAGFGSNAGENGGFHELNNKLYFFADEATIFGGLHQLGTDGTISLVSGAISTGSDAHFTYFDHALYFRAFSSAGDELVRLDGSGLVTPIDVNPGPANSFAGADGGFAAFHGSLYFSADTPATGEDLFRLDAGSTTPVPVEIDPGTQSSFAGEDSGFGVLNQTLYFNAFNAADLQSELFSLAAGSSTPSVVRDA